MKLSFKGLMAFTGSSTLFFTPAMDASAAQNICDANKDAIHCSFLSSSSSSLQGKFIKIKEMQKGHSAITMTMCVAPSQLLLNIPQNQWGNYQPGSNITWQFSQCMDEDCTTNKLLLDDKFTITKAGKVYSSGPKKSVEVVLDPTYGQDCKVDEGTAKKMVQLKHHLTPSSLQMRIDDAAALLQAIPGAFTQTSSILNNMRTIANDAATNSHTTQELINLNNQFQTLKDAIDMAQRVNTLDGYKTVSGGTITISIGSWYSFATLTIPLPATDQYSLSVWGQDVLSPSNAATAVSTIDNALNVVSYALSIKQ